MPAVPAIIGAGALIGGSLIKSNEDTSAGDKQAAANTYAANLQAQSAANTLKFEQQQANQTQANSVTAQNANYDQWLYRQGIARPYQGTGLAANNMLAQMWGLPPQSTTLPDEPARPNFQTGDGSSSGGSSSSLSGGGKTAPTIDPSKGDIGTQISAYFKSQGANDSETPYWVQKWSEFGANDPAYFNQRLQQADVFNT